MKTLFLFAIMVLLTSMSINQYRYLDVNWCSSEIQILRDQVSDLWYYYELDD